MGEPNKLLDGVREYLDAPRCAVLSTVDAAGIPQQVVVHYQLGRDALIVNGRADRHWISNLRRDNRASILIPDAGDSLHWVRITAAAQLLHEGDAGLKDAMAMARRYGEDPADYSDQDRVSFRLLPQRVYEYR